MILVDTSIWIDHLRYGNAALAGLLNAGQVLAHPFVTGEIALGSLKSRADILNLLDDLPAVTVASTAEVRALVDDRRLYSRGIGYVDISLIASCLLEPGSRIWTGDNRLSTLASELSIRFEPAVN